MNFANQMENVSGHSVATMVRRINLALDKRTTFERQKKPNGAHIELRDADRQLRGNTTVARFLCVIDGNPDLMLNRERKAGYRANLKAMRKIRMLAEYMAGEHGKINGVCKALFAATILASRANIFWVSNNDAELILSQIPVSTFQKSEELFSSYLEFSKLNISDPQEARNQACQFRTAFENLGCYYSSREDSNSSTANGIRANMDNPLMKALADTWGI